MSLNKTVHLKVFLYKIGKINFFLFFYEHVNLVLSNQAKKGSNITEWEISKHYLFQISHLLQSFTKANELLNSKMFHQIVMFHNMQMVLLRKNKLISSVEFLQKYEIQKKVNHFFTSNAFLNIT